jgi:peptidoglycan/xylan/chitin deacetylase (PgdA/CDA1 family)
MIFFFFLFIFLPLFFVLLSLSLMFMLTKSGVILFHRISKRLPKSLSQISVKQFEVFCRELALSQKKTVNFSDFLMQDDEVCISFDDGHRSIFDFAFPILKKYNFTATIFVASGIIKGKKINDFYNTKDMLSAENIKELSDKGFEIASHGVWHSDLTLLDENELRNELINSKTELENLTKKTVSALSFPYGSWNKKVLEVAEECGYKKFAVYRDHKFANNTKIIPATAIFPFDGKNEMKNKISGEIRGVTRVLSEIVPHFAKGTPVFFGNKSYDYGKLIENKRNS